MFTLMSLQVCVENTRDIMADRERTTSINLMVNIQRHLGASSGSLARVSVSSNGLFRDVLKSFWKDDVSGSSKGAYFYMESVRLSSSGFEVTFEAFTQNPDANHLLMLYVPNDSFNRREFANNPEKSVQIAKHVKSLMQNVNGVVGYAGVFMFSDRSFKLQANPFDMNDFTEVSFESDGPAFLKAVLRA